MDNSIIGNIVTVTVDRPLGSYHPVHKKLYYPVNYGYVKGILAPDGEEQDAYILGVDVPVEVYTGKVWPSSTEKMIGKTSGWFVLRT